LGGEAIILVCLYWSILLGFLLRWHREFLFRLRHGGRQCWGDTRKIRITTQTRVKFSTRSSTQLGRKETVMLSATSTSPKKSESVYTCPRAPFYRETEGLLHTDNTLGLREYS
jgi:hypothetical protein